MIDKIGEAYIKFGGDLIKTTSSHDGDYTLVNVIQDNATFIMAHVGLLLLVKLTNRR